MPYQTDFYTLQSLTNLHVGSGDANFGVVDKLVQRDILTCLPTIHESGLKGALREFCAHELAAQLSLTNDPIGTKGRKSKIQKANREPIMKSIFGDAEDGSGNYRFIGGQLVLFPVRVNAKEPFLYATSPTLLTELWTLANHLSVTIPDLTQLETLSKLAPDKNQPLVFTSTYAGLQVEYPDILTKLHTTPPEISDWLGGNKLVLLHIDDLKRIAGTDALPVMSRNNLEDGRSTNLWYEEIVPRQSLFSVFVTRTDTHQETDVFFDNCLNNPVQVGANATIGYGLMKLTKRS